MEFLKKILCVDCGVDVLARAQNRKRCADCKERKERTYIKNGIKKMKASGVNCSRCGRYIDRSGVCDQCRSYVTKWKRVNRLKVNEVNRTRRGDLRDGSGRILKSLLGAQNGKCAICGIKSDRWHRDHIIPRVLGGCSEMFNLQALCPPCNLKKHAKIIDPKIVVGQLRLCP